MNQSPEIDKIAPAIVDAQAEGLVVVAANKNSQTNSQYADLADIAAAVLPILTQHGIAVMQFVGRMRHEQTMINVGHDKIPGVILVAGVTTRIQHASGQFIEQEGEFPLATPPVSGKGSEILNWSQNYGLTLTYAKRYALVSALGIAVGDDRDAQNLQSALRESAEASDNQAPRYQTHWSDLIRGLWDGEFIEGYKMPLGEMSDEEKASLVLQKMHLKSPALVAFLWDRADRMLAEKGLTYADRPTGFPDDFRDMDAHQVKAFCAWAKTAEAKPAAEAGEVQP